MVEGRNKYGSLACICNKTLKTKGYRLVGCDLSGTNAFFVREDLAVKHFPKAGNPDLHFQTILLNNPEHRTDLSFHNLSFLCMTPSISACIPCLDHWETLPSAINSINRQTIPVKEILIIDDGSSSSCPIDLDKFPKLESIETKKTLDEDN